MLVSFSDMLSAAERGGYAVVAPEFPTLLTARALLEHAERRRAPLLLSFDPRLKPSCELTDFRQFIQITRQMAEARRVPVGIHLDHATRLEDILEAIAVGFTSVMLDASKSPWEENVRRTQEVVAFAHAAGVGVEAELGHVASGGAFFEANNPGDHHSVLTDPAEALEFVRQTGVDALAVAIGTIHGVYSGEPHLDFERLQALHVRVRVPLVLHGSSGTGEANLCRCVSLGIRKINVFSDVVNNVRLRLGESLNTPAHGPNDFTNAQINAIQEAIEPYLVYSASSGRV